MRCLAVLLSVRLAPAADVELAGPAVAAAPTEVAATPEESWTVCGEEELGQGAVAVVAPGQRRYRPGTLHTVGGQTACVSLGK